MTEIFSKNNTIYMALRIKLKNYLNIDSLFALDKWVEIKSIINLFYWPFLDLTDKIEIKELEKEWYLHQQNIAINLESFPKEYGIGEEFLRGISIEGFKCIRKVFKKNCLMMAVKSKRYFLLELAIARTLEKSLLCLK